MITIALSFVAGFLCGALVFRNNASKAEKIVTSAKDAFDDAKKYVEEIKK